MMTESGFKKGDLVVDADPYRAPEIHYGYGVIVELINLKYATVYWPKYNIQITVKTEYIAKIVEENT